ncbi:acyl-CoA thioesterase [Streptomyces albireticuli]|nr:thioesterase family protein [Streptomyces albireticuli]
MDSNGHVNSGAYSTYVEETRIRMFSDLIPSDPQERLTKNFFVFEQTIQFRRPLVYREKPVTVEAWTEDVGAARFVACCEIRDADTVYASSRTLMAGFDSIANRVRRFQESEREVIASFME